MGKLEGIKQVLRSEYESTPPADRRNYWWLVRETTTSIKGTLRPQFLPVDGCETVYGENNVGGNISYGTSVCEIVIYGGQPGVSLLAIERDLDGASQREFKYVWDEGRMLHTLHEFRGSKKVYAYLYLPTLLTNNSTKNKIGVKTDNGQYEYTSEINESLISCLSIETEYYPTSVYFGNRLYSTDPKINEVFIQNQFMRLENLLMGSGFSNEYSGLVANEISMKNLRYSNLIELNHKSRGNIGGLFSNNFSYIGSNIDGYSFLGAFLNLYYGQSSIMNYVSIMSNKPAFYDGISTSLTELRNWAIINNAGVVPNSIFADLSSLYKLTFGYNSGLGITNCFSWVYEQVRELATSANTNLNKL